MNAVATFLDFAWLFESARIYICSRCGKILWFLPQTNVDAMSTSAADEDYDIDCVQCGSVIRAGESTCAECGWTYKTDGAS